ncbi:MULTISPECIES: hypothetical protein [Bacteroides]|uniref:hypothetical protein n=1 Tax=Bacteroides TaxID=816 RepID=UPI0003411E8D|nr:MULTISPECIES: hypothetical protein [Bacteroides]MBM6945437.1 hypothetical protein [Bacteroides gallinaceum]OUO55915.1 hypothetical protein B5F78_10145 [Bacteroides sp. An279]CCZ69757.1 unknown [Bacteroides sp. CAG:702]
MSTFILTARSDMFLTPDCIIRKGSVFEINSFDPVANSVNLFNNPERRMNIMSQFAAQGLDFSAQRKEFMMSGGYWDIVERPNRLI